MTDTVTTRIKLPGEVHRNVKAEAARRGVNLDQALGMCVAFLCSVTVPLCWMDGMGKVTEDFGDAVDAWAFED